MTDFYKIIISYRGALKKCCADYGISEIDMDVLITIDANNRPMYVREIVPKMDYVDAERILESVKKMRDWGWLTSPQKFVHVDSSKLWGLTQIAVDVLAGLRIIFNKNLESL